MIEDEHTDTKKMKKERTLPALIHFTMNIKHILFIVNYGQVLVRFERNV